MSLHQLSYQEYTNGQFLVCPVFENMTIESNEDSKWFVDMSVSELFDEGDEMYPPYCSGYTVKCHGKRLIILFLGWLYVTNRKTATR